MKLTQSYASTPITWDSIKSGTDLTAYLAYSTTNMPVAGAATRRGYLQSATDTSTATSVTNVGHTFGRLGEGKLSYYSSTTPFYWGESATANRPKINLSIFPDADTDAGLNGATKFVTFTAKCFDWEDNANFDVPT